MEINKNSSPSRGSTGVNFTVVKALQGRSEARSVRHKTAFAQDHGEHAESTLVKLKRGAGGETSPIALTSGEVLYSALENIVLPDLDSICAAGLIKRRPRRRVYFV